MSETYAKKELEKKRARKKQEKKDKKEDRKDNNNKGKALEDMFIYVDEMGALTDVPPSKQIRKKINANDIPVSTVPASNEIVVLEGVVSLFFDDKGYGFITENESRVNVFVHTTDIRDRISVKDKVLFEKEMSPRGYVARNVRKA